LCFPTRRDYEFAREFTLQHNLRERVHQLAKSPSRTSLFRNAHFLSVAVSWAEVIGAHCIYIDAVAEDSSGYPDCRPEYYRVFQELIRVGTRPETNMEIATPVICLKKSEIIRKGIELGAPLHLTWSCYQSEDTPCGVCDSCLLRMRAFAEAGASDPISQRGAAAHS
jgi:7-cyano-7-deazaguanine synthase